eukprot:scaffold7406_cov41-Prasinocladus_malaysianus.AAC.1
MVTGRRSSRLAAKKNGEPQSVETAKHVEKSDFKSGHHHPKRKRSHISRRRSQTSAPDLVAVKPEEPMKPTFDATDDMEDSPSGLVSHELKEEELLTGHNEIPRKRAKLLPCCKSVTDLVSATESHHCSSGQNFLPAIEPADTVQVCRSRHVVDVNGFETEVFRADHVKHNVKAATRRFRKGEHAIDLQMNVAFLDASFITEVI